VLSVVHLINKIKIFSPSSSRLVLPPLASSFLGRLARLSPLPLPPPPTVVSDHCEPRARVWLPPPNRARGLAALRGGRSRLGSTPPGSIRFGERPPPPACFVCLGSWAMWVWRNSREFWSKWISDYFSFVGRDCLGCERPVVRSPSHSGGVYISAILSRFTVELGLRSGRIYVIPCVAGAATHCPDGS